MSTTVTQTNPPPDSSTEKVELASLRRVAEGIPTAAWFIIINEFCERFAYYGGTQVFQNYVQFPPGTGDRSSADYQAGALNKGQATATALNQFFTFFCYVTPLLGATLSDQYLGKFKTIIIFSTIYMCGWIILTTTSIPAAQAAGVSYPGFIVSLLVIGLGTGGIKSIVSPMAAEQYKNKEAYVKVVNGERVVVDPDMSVQHLYNWFYWAINVGALIGGILSPKLEQMVDFWAAFLVPSLMFVLSLIVFIGGRRRYVRNPPAGSIILKAFRCLKGGLEPSQPVPNVKKDPTRDWDSKFVDELKQTLMACKIFIPMCIYWVAYSQINTNLISQAADMSRPAGVPNDIMGNIDPLALIIFIPIMDVWGFPFISKIGIEFFAVRRITFGFFLGALAMLWSAFVQHMIDTNPVNTVNVWWQIPSYVLIAFSEIFASIASLEYSYTHAPTTMKSLISALALFPNAIASLLGLAISPLAQPGVLVYMYLGIGGATLFTGILFWFFFHHYDKIDMEYRYNKNKDEKAEPLREVQRPPSALIHNMHRVSQESV